MKINKKVVGWSIGFFLLGLFFAPTKEVEVIKTVPADTVATKQEECIQEDCNCTELIALYEKTIELDDNALGVSKDIIGLCKPSIMATLNEDVNEIKRISGVLSKLTDELNSITPKRLDVLTHIKLLNK